MLDCKILKFNHMKTLNKLIIFIVLVLAIISCSDDFLEQEPTNLLSDDVILSSTDALEVAINGSYRSLASYALDGLFYEGMADVRSGDAVMASASNYGWFINPYRFNLTATSRYSVWPWEVAYEVIDNANVIINNIEQVPGDETEKNQLYGEALCLRAYSYMLLATMFADKPYSVNPDAMCVPLRLTSEDVANDPHLARASVGDVYNQIIEDLSEAEPLLGFVRTGRFSQRAAQGLLARAYLEMENWEQASSWAATCHGDQELQTEDMTSGFFDYNNETIFGYDFTDTDNGIFLSHPSFWYLDGPESGNLYGYSTLLYTPEFVSIFDANDARNMFIRSDTTLVEEVGAIASNFFGVAAHYTYKFRHRNDFLGQARLIRMRVAEMYLIEAEAEAQLTHYDNAQQALFEVQSRSIPGATQSTYTGATLLDEIYLERRKELYGEGFGVWDLMRLQLPVDRSSPVHWGYTEDIIPANADILSLPIPQDEIDANDLITEEDQNPAYN